MRLRRSSATIFAFALASVVGMVMSSMHAQQGATISIDPDDIGGVVTSANGPEGGVWVVAETTETPTKFVKIVVTDEQGRYVIPDLPRATYQVFVRGYGLVDSKRVPAKPGQRLNLTATGASDARATAAVYPAAWWFSMVRLPEGADQQLKFMQNTKGCFDCHQLGTKETRTFAPYVTGATHLEKWDMRVKLGPSGAGMNADFMRHGEARRSFAAWTEAVEKGEVPRNAPPRPNGVERNLVISLWDWGTPIEGRADNVAADLRNPLITPNGKIYGVAQSNDELQELDPVENSAKRIKVPVDGAPPRASQPASPNFGPNMYSAVGVPRSVAVDHRGRVWFTLRFREDAKQPASCGGAGANAFGKYLPIGQSGKQVAVYDPKTEKFERIDTCFRVDHNELSHDNFVYYGSNNLVGWVDINTWDKTHDASKSTGWCPAIVDTNGDGKITSGWTEIDQPIDPTKDHRVGFGCYSIAVNEKDGSLWCSGNGERDMRLTRLEKGPNPPETCRAEIYEPPPGPQAGLPLIGSGGVTVSADGIVYDAWRVSGHFTVFDRSKCKSTKDPKADGQSCPEGWSIYRNDNLPSYSNSPYKASEAYLLYMDRHDTLGFGKDVPIYSSMNTDSMEVFNPVTRQFTTLRVPYPHSFFARSGTGRIDDPKTGWKGKGFWSSYSTYASWHIEGGKGTLPKAVKMQMRPNPLAK